MKRKFILLGISAAAFIVFGCICLNSVEAQNNEDILLATQNSFRSVAEKVYPAVVSVTTVQIERKRGGVYYIPHSDPLFDNFFGDFFGGRKQGFGFRMPDKEFKKVGIGSGVIIDPRGYVLTNYHVVDKAFENQVTIKLTDGRELEGIVKGTDPRYDIALVKISGGGEFPAATLGDSNQLAVGDWAIAIGNPYGFAFDDAVPTMTVGVVSALNRSLPGWVGMERTYTNLIQTDAAINVGNSGGPLVNIKGEIVGINVAIVSTSGGSQGIGFAVPSALCNDIIAEVIEGKEILYSWLGLSVQNLNQELAEYFRYPDTDGVVVVQALPNSPAKIGGIRDGDIVTFFNDRPIKRIEDLLDMVHKAQVGEPVTIIVFRNEIEQEIAVLMGSRPQEMKRHEGVDTLYWNGIKVDNITYEIARDLNIPTLKGVVITDIQPESPADRAGLTAGEVIVKMNNKTVNNVDDYYAAVYEMGGEVLVKTLRGYFVVRSSR